MVRDLVILLSIGSDLVASHAASNLGATLGVLSGFAASRLKLRELGG